MNVFTVNVDRFNASILNKYSFCKKTNPNWPQVLNGIVYINHLNTVHIYVNMTKVKETNLLVQILEINWM